VLIEASNLGQIIGRLMYADAAEAHRADPAPTQPKRIGRREQVLELAGRQAEIACADVARELGITSDHAAVVLNLLMRENLLVRSGTRCLYRYRLA
jgi:hypothetical protein